MIRIKTTEQALALSKILLDIAEEYPGVSIAQFHNGLISVARLEGVVTLVHSTGKVRSVRMEGEDAT